MKNTVQVLGILRAVCNHTVDRRGLNQLIDLTQSLAYTYLKYRYRNLHNTLMGEDVSLNEMAIDAIAPLFERDDEGGFVRIINAFEKWEPKIEREEQAFFFLNRLTARSVEKYVSDLLKDSHPLFAKILRSVNYLVRSGGFLKKQILGTTYITHKEELRIGKLPDNQCVYDLPDSLFRTGRTIIDNVFRYLREYTDREEAIPLNAFVIKIKNTGADINFENRTEFRNTLDIDAVTDNALRNAFCKLEESYLDKNKITAVESEAFRSALEKIVVDLKDGGINNGVHSYLIEEMQGLTIEVYKEKYQNILEYLIKLIKKDILHHLRE